MLPARIAGSFFGQRPSVPVARAPVCLAGWLLLFGLARQVIMRARDRAAA